MAKAKAQTAQSKLPVIYGSYQWKTCRQVMEVIRVADVYMFRYTESSTNKNQLLNLSLDNFELAVKFGNLIKIS